MCQVRTAEVMHEERRKRKQSEQEVEAETKNNNKEGNQTTKMERQPKANADLSLSQLTAVSRRRNGRYREVRI